MHNKKKKKHCAVLLLLLGPLWGEFCRRCSPCESHPSLPPAAHASFFSSETPCMDTCGLLFPLGGGGGERVASLPAFNRDALTNRRRIRLLDKASFILTLRVTQLLRVEMMKAGESTFLRGCWGGSTDGLMYLDVLCLIMPEPSACTHTNTYIPEAGSFPSSPLAGDSSAYFSQQSRSSASVGGGARGGYVRRRGPTVLLCRSYKE